MKLVSAVLHGDEQHAAVSEHMFTLTVEQSYEVKYHTEAAFGRRINLIHVSLCRDRSMALRASPRHCLSKPLLTLLTLDSRRKCKVHRSLRDACEAKKTSENQPDEQRIPRTRREVCQAVRFPHPRLFLPDVARCDVWTNRDMTRRFL